MKDAKIDLMIFALRNQNEAFLKFAFKESIFGPQSFEDESLRTELLDMLSHKAKTELVLNVLIFADFSRWPQRDLRDFIDYVSEITSMGHEQNRILLTYNPILTICLACNHLTAIGRSISVFAHEGAGLCEEMLDLGSKLIENMAEESVRPMFMDTDFKDRTVLHLITYSGYAPLMADQKIAALLDELWVGKLTYDCDGKNEDFSLLAFLARAPVKKLPGQTIKVQQLLSNKFSVQIVEENFAYQYKFRRASIAVLFQKNFVSAIIQVAIFQFINYQYLQLFNAKVLTKLDTE